MRFDTEQEAQIWGVGTAAARQSVILTTIEGEELVSMRGLPRNCEWLMPPAVAGELAVAMMDAAIAGASDTEADVVGETALNVLVGLPVHPMSVEYNATTAAIRARLVEQRRRGSIEAHPYELSVRKVGFPTVMNGITGAAHLARFEVESCFQQDGYGGPRYASISVTAINRGTMAASGLNLPPAMAYDVAHGLLSIWRDYAPETSIAAMRTRIATLCRTKADPSPVAKVTTFYGAGPSPRVKQTAPASGDDAVNADDLLDELLTATPRR